MYCRNYTETVSHVLCREVYYTVSLFGRVHYQRFYCRLKFMPRELQDYVCFSMYCIIMSLGQGLVSYVCV